ncbi:hypothetical protein [Pseudoduganella namucuonensis]|uniref:Uncharacterized protein n=1 Tax=Pseudoduganella namucuonensis TaxID=1035707 RepID=A0A1I7HQY3_9BURK|nr:hypothetical protein [Pseudoduganella namucuonensis]SFU63155.1 hypothetical protein SAMN05216552_1006124 [Pseudoduganella namucuonensis]
MTNVSMLTNGNNIDAGDLIASLSDELPGSDRLLGGFDQVWALAPETVNKQFASMRQHGLLPRAVQVGDLDEAGLLIGGEGVDRAVLATPGISFDTGAPRMARLSLTFNSGNMSFYNGFGNRTSILKQSIAGWKIAFNVKVQLLPVAMQDLLNGAAPAAPGTINRIGRFDEAHFRLQAAVLDFEQSDLMHPDAAHTDLATDNSFLANNFANFIGAWLKGLAGPGNPFVLGYAVTRKTHAADILEGLLPCGANLAACGTLNFLQVSGERKIAHEPRLYSGTAGHFNPPPPVAEGAAGKLIVSRETFFKRFLKPLLVDPIQRRLTALPDYLHARRDQEGELDLDETVNEKSGAAATLDNGARAAFVPNAHGWSYRDHVLLHWREGNRHLHDRESEQDLQFSVSVSSQPDAQGVSRLTVDLYSSLMRYEWDRMNQRVAPFMRKTYMGKGWARTTMHWSMRLQFVPAPNGGIAVTVGGKRAPAATDSGVVGMYVVSDALAHLLNMNKITNDWEGNHAGFAALQGSVMVELGAAATAMFGQAAGQLVLPAGPQLCYRGIQLNEDGNIELDLVHEER